MNAQVLFFMSLINFTPIFSAHQKIDPSEYDNPLNVAAKKNDIESLEKVLQLKTDNGKRFIDCCQLLETLLQGQKRNECVISLLIKASSTESLKKLNNHYNGELIKHLTGQDFSQTTVLSPLFEKGIEPYSSTMNRQRPTFAERTMEALYTKYKLIKEREQKKLERALEQALIEIAPMTESVESSISSQSSELEYVQEKKEDSDQWLPLEVVSPTADSIESSIDSQPLSESRSIQEEEEEMYELEPLSEWLSL